MCAIQKDRPLVERVSQNTRMCRSVFTVEAPRFIALKERPSEMARRSPGISEHVLTYEGFKLI